MMSSRAAISDCRLADQLVELLDHFADLGAKLLVAVIGGSARAERALDARKSGLCPVERSRKTPVVHRVRLRESGLAPQALTLHGSPSKGRAPPCRSPTAASPTPSALSRWTRLRPPTAAIRACRWAWPMRRRLCSRGT